MRCRREELIQKQLDTNFRIMEQIRARVDAIVEDPKTAAALKPYYPYGCKRPTFHDEYLPTFNLPHVTWSTPHRSGSRQINERGVVHDGRRVPARRADLRDRLPVDGHLDVQHDRRAAAAARCSEKWQTEGTKTFLGLHSHGFPNLFIVTGPQGGGGSFNFTDAIDAHADYVVWMLETMRDARRVDVVDVATRARRTSTPSTAVTPTSARAPLRDCLSYYNGHGEAEPGSLAYYGGNQWHKFRAAAQQTLDPYLFEERN